MSANQITVSAKAWRDMEQAVLNGERERAEACKEIESLRQRVRELEARIAGATPIPHHQVDWPTEDEA